VDQGVDQLPCKHKALSSNSQKIKKKNDKEWNLHKNLYVYLVLLSKLLIDVLCK
jgi:hypothetical protein